MDDTILNNKENIPREYFYAINYPVFEENLCEMEMKYLFNKKSQGKYFFTDKYVNPSRSPFIKESISIIYSGESLDYIVQKIVEDKLAYDDFKVCYIKIEGGDIEYKERLSSLREIGWAIKGEPDMHNPKVTLGVTKFEGRWIFGIYEKNDYEWHIHDHKPFSYSNSLSLRVSRAVVNIAVGNNLECKLVDPCCGVGTVVLEALSMGIIDTSGYEINEHIASNAIRNLEFFGYKNVIEHKDMHTLEDRYDVAIVDLPYGLFSPTTLKDQTDIMKTARKIADKLVIVTFEDMDDHIREAGFNIVDSCYVCKGKFKRYINICN